ASADCAAIVRDACLLCEIAEPLAFSLRTVAEQDWVRLTQSQFEPIHIGRHIWVVPSWHEAPEPDAVVLELDPGLAFGTGIRTVENMAQAEARANPSRGDKGGDAARAALALYALKRSA
ncbi:MAG: 6,7-dimethyl-8-ribityllumazine synthase, partial [Rhabdaerophilum sp.]